MGSKNKFMAYYNGKKIFSIVKTVEEPIVEADGGDFRVSFAGSDFTSFSFKKTFKDAFPNLRNADKMFSQCRKLTSVDFSGLDTSNLTSVDSMFDSCTSLKMFDFSKLDISNVESMSNMFYSSGLASIDMSSLDVGKATTMYQMFRQCQELKTVVLKNMKAQNLQDIGIVFYDCEKLVSADLSNIVAGNLRNMYSMFAFCRSLVSVDLSNLDTSKVTNMQRMFGSCVNLKSLDLSSFDTSNVTNTAWMFSGCSSLSSLRFPSSKSFDIHETALAHDALVVLLGDLKTVTSTQTLTMGSTKLALLSDAEKKIATDKGWTLA